MSVDVKAVSEALRSLDSAIAESHMSAHIAKTIILEFSEVIASKDRQVAALKTEIAALRSEVDRLQPKETSTGAT